MAASLMILLGLFHFLSGIAAFARANFYSIGANYPYQVVNDAWGWIHVIGGVLVAISGLTLFGRSAAARWVAIVLASVSLVINFFFVPYFPLWGLLMLALAIFAIWAVVRDGSEQRQREQEMSQRLAAAAMAPAGLAEAQQAGQRRETVAATYGEAQTGQRWPENAGREAQQTQGRWSPADVKESASRATDKAQERVKSGAQAANQAGARAQQQQQQGRSAAEQAAERARQSADRDYRSGS